MGAGDDGVISQFVRDGTIPRFQVSIDFDGIPFFCVTNILDSDIVMLAPGWWRDREALLRLPPAPYETCKKKPARVSSLSLVRHRGYDYSVPTAYGHREVLVRGCVHEVVIACAGDSRSSFE